MLGLPRYVLDANVFIEAHRRYYGFDLCPGFWDCLLHYNQGSRVTSIDRVRKELGDQDALGDWAKKASGELFASSDTDEVVKWYTQMIGWVQRQDQYRTAALNQFANVADGWVVAYARAEGLTVVTHEAYAPNAKRRVPIPNLCRAFRVKYVNTFDMLRALHASFHWEKR